MPAYLLPARTSCSASNAYNPASALSAAFAARVNNHPKRARYPRVHWIQASHLTASHRAYNTINNSEAPKDSAETRAPGNAGKHEGLHEDSNARVKVRYQMVSPNPSIANWNDRNDIRAREQQLREREQEQGGATLDSYRHRHAEPGVQRIGVASWQVQIRQIQDLIAAEPKKSVDNDDQATGAELKEQTAYEPQVIHPFHTVAAQGMRPPWIAPQEDWPNKDSMAILDDEIARFYTHTRRSKQETAAREAVIAQMKSLIRMHGGKVVECEVFGSERTGLYSLDSDIDLRIFFPLGIGSRRPHALTQRMNSIFVQLKRNPRSSFTHVEMRHGSHPIITAWHRQAGLIVQIVATGSTEHQRDVTSNLVATVPHIGPLYTLLRTALGIRGLNDTFYGGIGSYPLFVMLAAILQRPRTWPADQTLPTAAAQLLHILEFYSTLDTTRYGVSAQRPHLFLKHDPTTLPFHALTTAATRRRQPFRAARWRLVQRRPGLPWALVIQDPASPKNNPARNALAVRHVQATFADMLVRLRARLATVDTHGVTNMYRSRESVLEPVVGRSHEIYVGRRRWTAAYGRRALEGEFGPEWRETGQQGPIIRRLQTRQLDWDLATSAETDLENTVVRKVNSVRAANADVVETEAMEAGEADVEAGEAEQARKSELEQAHREREELDRAEEAHFTDRGGRL